MGKSALPGFKETFTSSSCLRGISWDGFDAKLIERPADLGKVRKIDLRACRGRSEEVAGAVGVNGAEDAFGANGMT